MDTSSLSRSELGNTGASKAERVEGSDWLLSNMDLIARDRSVLDVASGRGRHALLLAARGWDVHAVDRDATALAALGARARAQGVLVQTACVDLERDEADLGENRYGTILVFNYLHRPLFPAIRRALAPGGVLLYETFTIGQRERGHPRNPAYLLQDGELPRLVAPLAILRSREGDYGGRLVASVAARKQLP
jgi:SAM-dependent methyltransferase